MLEFHYFTQLPGGNVNIHALLEKQRGNTFTLYLELK